MKKKRSNKRSKTPPKKSPLKVASVPASVPPMEAATLQRTVTVVMPPPEMLFREAEEEQDLRSLSEYVDSIRTLRDKGFSYREIAQWLSERGVEADHNAVYRVYTNSLSDYEAQLESQREDEEAREEAMRNT
jgi:hypothetical protein